MPTLIKAEKKYQLPVETYLCDDGDEIQEIPDSAPPGSIALILTDSGLQTKMKSNSGDWRSTSGSSGAIDISENVSTLLLTDNYSSETNKILNGAATLIYTKISNRIFFDVTIGLVGVTASPSTPYLVEFEELPFYSSSLFDAPYYDFNTGQLAALVRGSANKNTMKLYVYKDYNNPGAQITIHGSYRVKQE